MTLVTRSIATPIRERPTLEERLGDTTRGLITSWEAGRQLAAAEDPRTAAAKAGALPVLPWRGGIDKPPKSGKKTGHLYYVAMWQGLRGDDLHIDTTNPPGLICARTGVKVSFSFHTPDILDPDE